VSPALGHIRRAVHLRLSRHAPEVGAGCGKAARPVLCGGRIAICVPTAIRISQWRTILVSAVTPGTAASGAGVQPGDILQKVNGKVPPPLYELDKLLALPGASITITILRSGKQKTMTIHLRRLV